MDQFKFKRYIPISKVDEEERMVYGFASTPDLDSDGEIITLEAIKGALPGYLQFPTIREMHQAKAAGTTKNAEIKDSKTEKGLYIGAKIVADDAWNLVKEGVYKGFSIGGHVIKKVGNIIEALELVEISLVDVPANKQAKIEVWKSDTRGGDKMKIQKDAGGVYNLTSLMAHCQDCMSYMEYKGKDKECKKLGKMVEQIKGMISEEAMEPEMEHKPGEDMMMSASAEVIKTKITSLEKMNFGDNPVANLIREEVIKAMKTKADELEEKTDAQESEAAEETTAEETTGAEGEEGSEAGSDTTGAESTDETTDETEGEEGTDGEGDGAEGEKPEGEEEGEDKESSESPTLKKLDSIEAMLTKMAPAPAKAEDNTDLTKSVEKVAGSLEKVVTMLSDLKGRVEKLESQPLPAKSKSAEVAKAINASGEEKTEEKPAEAGSELAQKEARLTELNKMFDEMGAHAFAKQGFSTEASTLQKEIAELKRKGA